MQFHSLANGYFLVFKKGEQLIQELSLFCRQKNLQACSIQAIGGVNSATIGFYDLQAREYEWLTLNETLEIVSLSGNISLKDEQPFIHAHVSLGKRDKSVVGGHLQEATVGGTVEMQITNIDVPLIRTPDAETGLSLLRF